MNPMRTVLSGKKTYIVGGMMIAIGLVEGFAGIDIPGVVIPEDDWVGYILQGAGLGTLRSGIAKMGAK